MDYLRMLKLLTLLFLVDLGSAAESYKSYEQISDGIDWRQYGYISAVQNQGNCQASWALSAAGAVEAHLAIKNRRLVELSAQQLVDCTPYPSYGCDGGWSSLAFNYTRDHGIASKASYPYRAVKSPCSYDPSTKVGTIRRYETLRYADEKQMAETVYNVGPVVVAIDALQESFLHYKSGIYRDGDCRSEKAHINQAFLVVGFGTDSIYGDYWILKTSFGQDWGENGYMKLARNAGNMCGIASLAQYPIV